MHSTRLTHSLLSVFGLVALVAGALFTTGTARAATPGPAAKGATGVHWVRLPPAPRTAASVGPAATAPTTSPAAGYKEFAPGSIAPCSNGVLCAAAWNPVSGKWRQFNLSVCATYKLAYWQGGGTYFDNQTGGVTSYFYGQGGNVLTSFTPDATSHPYNWDPVWSIRNC